MNITACYHSGDATEHHLKVKECKKRRSKLEKKKTKTKNTDQKNPTIVREETEALESAKQMDLCCVCAVYRWIKTYQFGSLVLFQKELLLKR